MQSGCLLCCRRVSDRGEVMDCEGDGLWTMDGVMGRMLTVEVALALAPQQIDARGPADAGGCNGDLQIPAHGADGARAPRLIRAALPTSLAARTYVRVHGPRHV